MRACATDVCECEFKEDESSDHYRFWTAFNARQVVLEYYEHKHYLQLAFKTYGSHFPKVTQAIIDRHDVSKLSFLEVLGYTDKFVHGRNSTLWLLALHHHYMSNSHHPQFWVHSNGQENTIHRQEDMSPTALQESVLDMVAVVWNKIKKNDTIGLFSFEDRYLERYTPEDAERVRVMAKTVLYHDALK